MLVYDITDRQSFEELRGKFIEQVKQNVMDGVVQAIIGNKCDMVTSREVSYEEAQNLAQEIGVQYFEVSCKENINIETAFQEVIQAAANK